MTDVNHQPKTLHFAKDGPHVVAFARSDADGVADESAHRFKFNALLREWCSTHGHVEPYLVLNGDRDSLLKSVTDKCILLVPRWRDVLRKPSDVAEIISVLLKRDARLIVIEHGPSDVNSILSLVRSISDAYLPVEDEVKKLRNQAKEAELTHNEILDEAVASVVQKLTTKFLDLNAAISAIKEQAKDTVSNPLLRARKAQAAQLLQGIQQRQEREAEAARQKMNAEQWRMNRSEPAYGPL